MYVYIQGNLVSSKESFRGTSMIDSRVRFKIFSERRMHTLVCTWVNNFFTLTLKVVPFKLKNAENFLKFREYVGYVIEIISECFHRAVSVILKKQCR